MTPDPLAARVHALELQIDELEGQMQWIQEIVEGREVSEFAESFPLVKAVADLSYAKTLCLKRCFELEAILARHGVSDR